MMKTFTAKQAKDHFGLLLDPVRSKSVTIEKKNRKVAVLMSLEEYARLEALEEKFRAVQADITLKEEFIGHKQSEKLLRDILHTQD